MDQLETLEINSSYENCKCIRTDNNELHLVLFSSNEQLNDATKLSFIVIGLFDTVWLLKEINIKLDKLNDQKTVVTSSHINACFTRLNNYLAVSVRSRIYLIDLSDPNKQILKRLKIEHQNVTKLFPINQTDDVIIESTHAENERSLVLIDFVNEKKINISVQPEKDCYIQKVRVFDRTLSVKVRMKKSGSERLVLLDLNDKLGLENAIFTGEYKKNDLKFFQVVTTQIPVKRVYLIVHQEHNNLLTVHRLERTASVCSSTQIACVPLFGRVNGLIANDKFVILSVENQRIVSFLIADPLNENSYNMKLIKGLPSRYVYNSLFLRINFFQKNIFFLHNFSFQLVYKK